MSRFFYGKLAWNNIKKNKQTYFPYVLTCIGTVMMHYIILNLSQGESVEKIHGGEVMHEIFNLGSIVIAIFAVIFLFYTNSFLIKRRKKEFGIYNILGMEKRHLGRVVFWESVYSFLVSMAAGLGFGILFSKLVYLVVERILGMQMTLKFEIVPQAVEGAVVLFGVISVLNLLNTLRQIHLANPIELLKGGNVGEREPKTRWLLALAGAICLGIGYYMAIMIEDPVEAMALFFVAVLLVMAGTYALFTAGSIAVLKMLRKNKKFYYKPNHFISVSGMMYRMKQNAAGLASICVLSTGVLILISTTVSMYVGTEDTLRIRYPRNMYFDVRASREEAEGAIRELTGETLGVYQAKEQETLDYSYGADFLWRNGNEFFSTAELDEGDYANVDWMLLEDYNRLSGRQVELEPGEILLYQRGEELEGDRVIFGSASFAVKERLDSIPVPEASFFEGVDIYYMVVKDKEVRDCAVRGLYDADSQEFFTKQWKYYYGFDLEVSMEEQLQIYEDLNVKWQALGMDGQLRSMAEGRNSFYMINGGLLFLGIFLGFLFLMATILIIYYKQISEGYDDRERYQIMRKVGMSKREVKGAIRSQVLTVFYLPLVAAGCHIFFAFNMIRRALELMGMFNIGLFALCTVGTMVVFAALYCLVYTRTAKTYYKIIS